MSKNNKKKNPFFTIVVLIAIVAIGVFSYKNLNSISNTFSPDIKNRAVNEHIPPELRWEKSFRFGKDDAKDSKVGQNFLQYEANKNKNK